MIDIVILYILNKYDASIYRVSKIINELFFAYLKSSFGTILPALKRLEKLGCVEYREKMSQGGMKTKTYSITKTGKNHLREQLLSFESENPFYVVTEVKIALFMADVLDKNDLMEFKHNIRNILELHKIKLEKGLKNEYIKLNDTQKTTVEITTDEIESIIKTL